MQYYDCLWTKLQQYNYFQISLVAISTKIDEGNYNQIFGLIGRQKEHKTFYLSLKFLVGVIEIYTASCRRLSKATEVQTAIPRHLVENEVYGVFQILNFWVIVEMTSLGVVTVPRYENVDSNFYA